MSVEVKEMQTESDAVLPSLSVVVPVFNEEAVLDEFYRRLKPVLKSLRLDYEILFVNDGSTDSSPSLIDAIGTQDPHVGHIRLSRNFGKEAAMTAGLDHARGDAVVIMDADLQDPPDLIPGFIEKWREGFDVVYATRTSRQGESILKRVTSYLFYRVISGSSSVGIPKDTGDFRLLSRRAVDALGKLHERRRFMKGLYAWVGFPQASVPYPREPRREGTSKWNYWRLWNFALEGITSFSTVPLRIATYFGFLAALTGFIYGLFIIVDTLLYSNPVPGYPSLLVVILFLGGVQLMALGVIGEYLGRTFEESKQRPIYLIESMRIPADKKAK